MSNLSSSIELIVHISEAQNKIGDRILKGKQLKSIQVDSIHHLQQLIEKFNSWESFNAELLKSLFSTSELVVNYTAPFTIGGMSFKSLADKIREFHEGIDIKLNRLYAIIEKLDLIPMAAHVKPPVKIEEVDRHRLFVLYEQDNEAKSEVVDFIEKLGFQAIMLQQQTDHSKSFFEKFEQYTNIGFGLVVYANNSPQSSAQAKQNLALEHGFLIGKLGQTNVYPLMKGEIPPSSVSNIGYASMNSNRWQIDLAKTLRDAGFDIDMNKVI